MPVSDEIVEAGTAAAQPHIAEGIGAILRKFCDSPEALQARRYLHAMPEADWNTFVSMLAEEAARAALEAVAPMIREECAKVAEERATRARDNAATVKSGGFVDAMLNTNAAALDEIAAAIRSMGEKP